jgi:hypothetical protein
VGPDSGAPRRRNQRAVRSDTLAVFSDELESLAAASPDTAPRLPRAAAMHPTPPTVLAPPAADAGAIQPVAELFDQLNR